MKVLGASRYPSLNLTFSKLVGCPWLEYYRIAFVTARQERKNRHKRHRGPVVNFRPERDPENFGPGWLGARSASARKTGFVDQRSTLATIIPVRTRLLSGAAGPC